MRNIIIIGNGISGITCARHIRKKSNDPITIISAETDHFFSRTALMYIYMGHMQYEHTKPYEDGFWEKNKIQLVNGFVEKVETKSKTISLQGKGEMSFDILILAVGSKPNKFGWPGQDLKGVQGLYSYQDLVRMEENTVDIGNAVVVGGGLIGVEMTEMLHSRNIPVTFLVREEHYWDNVLPREEADMISRHVRNHHIDLQLNTQLKEILPDDEGNVKAITTTSGETIECQFVGLTVGVTPNIDFLKNSGIEIQRGILIDRYFETNIQDVYAIGDCAQFREPLKDRKPIEQVWYTGRIHGETLAKTILGTKTGYNPDPWFNSAKFLDIEYQVYGMVSNIPQQNEEHLYWEHSSGEKSIRIIYDKKDSSLIGINLMGVRFRHEVCNTWLKQKTPIAEVLNNLHLANFDPEFFKEYNQDVIELFNKKNPDLTIKVKTKKQPLKSFLSI